MEKLFSRFKLASGLLILSLTFVSCNLNSTSDIKTHKSIELQGLFPGNKVLLDSSFNIIFNPAEEIRNNFKLQLSVDSGLQWDQNFQVSDTGSNSLTIKISNVSRSLDCFFRLIQGYDTVFSQKFSVVGLVVTAPVNGGSFKIGDTLQVKWIAPNSSAVTPFLWLERAKGSDERYELLEGVKITVEQSEWGNFKWVIPDSLAGRIGTVAVEDYQFPDIYDKSPKKITFISGS